MVQMDPKDMSSIDRYLAETNGWSLPKYNVFRAGNVGARLKDTAGIYKTNDVYESYDESQYQNSMNNIADTRLEMRNIEAYNSVLNQLDDLRGNWVNKINALAEFAETAYIDGWNGGSANTYRNGIKLCCEKMMRSEKMVNNICWNLKQFGEKYKTQEAESEANASQIFNNL